MPAWSFKMKVLVKYYYVYISLQYIEQLLSGEDERDKNPMYFLFSLVTPVVIT